MIWSKRQRDGGNRSIVSITVICFSIADYSFSLYFCESLSVCVWVCILPINRFNLRQTVCEFHFMCAMREEKNYQIEFDSRNLLKVLINISSRHLICAHLPNAQNHSYSENYKKSRRANRFIGFVSFIKRLNGTRDRDGRTSSPYHLIDLAHQFHCVQFIYLLLLLLKMSGIETEKRQVDA